ncbi:hypothetical protein CYY_009755, partial [Polysphondylium violaceum]
KVGVNVIGINQAINSLGTESFVFTTSFDQWHSAGSVGFLLGFSKFIKQTRWQARDIIYVFSTEGGEDNGGTSMDISGISVWLHDYHSSNNINIQNLNYMTTIKQKGWTENNQRIMRAGQIYGAIGFDRIGRNSNNNINNNNNNNNNTDSNQQQKVVVYPEGLEGSLSNLDIINVITTTSFLNDIPAGINTHLQNEPVEGSLYGLLVFMWNSALSMPRSNHAIFTRYGINSVGISTDSSHNVWDFDFLNTPFHHKFKNRLDNNNSLSSFNNQTFYNLGKIMETVIHHLHNADEQLHQSYRWYMMAGAVFFIDLGQALLPVIVFNVGIFILLISLGLSTNDIAIKILLSLPWFIATLIYCLLQLCLPKLLSSNFISILPNRDLNPSNLLSFDWIQGIFKNNIENQIIGFSILYLVLCFIIYLVILLPISRYFTNSLLKQFPQYKNDWFGLQTILLLYYSLLGLMGMMLNNQFTCLFIVLSLPTLHFTCYLLVRNTKSIILKSIWMLVCLISHPIFLVFEFWSIWSIGWKKLFIGILLAYDNWGYLFYPFFIFGLQPIFFVRQLVNNKQLYFIGGGWAQNDEAAAHYEAIINQMTLGHQFLLSEFGVTPSVGWQIDPFGPSTLTATAFSLMSFKYHVIDRLDDRLKHIYTNTPDIKNSGSMISNQDFEFIWYPSNNYGRELSIFTHILDNMYTSPSLCVYPNASDPNFSICTGFDFEGDPDINPPINESNINERASILVEIIKQRSSYYRHNNLLLPFGSDFRFQDATVEFINMDKLIKYINTNTSFGVNIQYSTLDDYFDTVFQEVVNVNETFPEIQGQDYYTYTMCLTTDYQLYNTCVNYWSGYFTSYPLLKQTARDSDSLLRNAEILYSLASAYGNGFDFDFTPSYESLSYHRNVSGILTHHDAITGTAKEYVRDDYFQMLYQAQNQTLQNAIPSLVEFLLANKSIPFNYTTDSSILLDIKNDDVYAVSFTNSLAWDRQEFVCLEISNQYIAVYNDKLESIESQIVNRIDKGGKFYLYFMVNTPALGINTFFILGLSSTTNSNQFIFENSNIISKPILPFYSNNINIKSSSSISIGNSLFNLNFKFNTKNNNILRLESFDDLARNIKSIPLVQELIEYESKNDDAYKFRPKDYPTTLLAETPQFYYTQGPIIQLITIVYSNNCSQSFSVYNSTFNNGSFLNSNQYFEIENIVSVGWNKEISMRFNTSINNGQTFYTNNGVEVLQRNFIEKFNDSSPSSLISGNFYPVINTGYIVDQHNQLTVLSKQTNGASSQDNGVFEYLLIRRSNFTQWSVGEPMNDISNPSLKFRILFGTPNNVESIRTPHSIIFENPLMPVFTSSVQQVGLLKWINTFNTRFEPLTHSFPYNLHLVTLTKQWIDSSTNIIRLMNIYEINQNQQYSQPLNVNINSLFNLNFNISAVYETNLSANQKISNLEYDILTTTLNPIQLKTFVFELNAK